MARLFDDAATEYLKTDTPPAISLPFAVSCWVNTNDTNADQAIFWYGDKDVVSTEHMIIHSSVTHLWQAASRVTGSGVQVAAASIQATPNTWEHVVGIWVTTTDRRILLNGGNKGTNAGAANPAGLDRISIGVSGRVGLVNYMSGYIAEEAVYDLSIYPGATDSDKADYFEANILPSLAKGFSPQFYPSGLVAYWPLVRGINDKVGGYNMTAVGTVAAAHPKIIQPSGVL